MWRYALGVCGVFTIGIYGLDWMVHTQPSRGEIREMIWFGPDSTEGVSYATLRLRSCGRQRHVLRVQANRVSSFDLGRDYRSSTLVPREWLQAPVGGGFARELPLNLAPWSGRHLSLVSETQFRSGVSGTATYDKRTQRVEFTIDSTVEPLGRRFLLMTYNLNGKGMLRSHTVRPSTLAGRSRVTVTANAGNGTVVGSPSGAPGGVTASTRVFRQDWTTILRLSGGTAPRVMVAWAPEELQPGLGLSSEDVLFRQERTLDSRGRPYREYREFRRSGDEGEPYYLLHQQLIVQEIALEVR